MSKPTIFKATLKDGPEGQREEWSRLFEWATNRLIANDEEFKKVLLRAGEIVVKEVLYGASERENIDYILVENLMRALHVAIEARKAHGFADIAETIGWQSSLEALKQGRHFEIRKKP